MSKAAGLLRGSGLYAVGNFVPKVLAMVMIPVYTYLLTKREYGIVTYVTSLSAITLAITEMGFRSSVVRFYFDYEHDHEKLRRFLGSCSTYLLGTGLLLTAAAVATGHIWGPILVKDPGMTFWPFLALGVLIALGQLGYVVPMSLMRAREQAWPYAMLQIIEYVLIAGLVVIALVGFEATARAALWARLAAVAVMFLLATWLVRRDLSLALDMSMLRQALVYGLPLTAHAIANWAHTFIDRVLLERMTTLDQVGVYSLGYNVGMLMSAINLAFNRAFLPYHFREARDNPEGKRHLAGIAEDYWIFLALAGAFGALFAREGIMLLTPERFYAAHRVVPWVIAGYLAHGLYYPQVNNLLMLKKTKAIPIATVTAALVNVALNLWWIPKWNIVGAAAATTVSYVVLASIVYVWAQRIERMPYRLLRVAPAVAGFAAIGLGVHLVELGPEQILVPLAVKAAVFIAFLGFLIAVRLIEPSRVIRLLKSVIRAGGDDER